jgi:hypothetical protein
MFILNISFVIFLAAFGQTQELKITKLQDPTLSGLPDEILASQLIYTYSPKTRGNAPHFHSGPALGYVLKGMYLFQVK